MKLSITAEISGEEIVQGFVRDLKDNKIDVSIGSVKVIVLNKNGEPVEVAAEKIKLIFSN
jgi:hypothetical protein